MYVLEWRIVSALTRGLFWCLFPELRSNEGNKYQNNPRVSAETVRHESTYIILFLTRHNESINDYKNDEFYTSSRVALARFSFCWWRHNRLLMTSQWPGNCDAITWIVISNSLDIDFIHGDIHGRSCKKSYSFAIYVMNNGRNEFANNRVTKGRVCVSPTSQFVRRLNDIYIYIYIYIYKYIYIVCVMIHVTP